MGFHYPPERPLRILGHTICLIKNYDLVWGTWILAIFRSALWRLARKILYLLSYDRNATLI